MSGQDRPELSVVIPAYNNAPVLPEAIASVRAQRGPSQEILVVDDGSTDATPNVLKELAGPDLRVIRQSNGGPGAARNAGIAAARGSWIALLDADDVWLPGKLEAQFAALRQRPEARFCFADVTVRYPDGMEIRHECHPARHSLFIELLRGNGFATSSAFIHRDCFHEIGAFDPALRTGEDWDMWLRLAASYDVALVSQPFVLVRRCDDPAKYPLRMLEWCTTKVLDRLFENERIARRHPELVGLRRRIYAWHHAVLAKSYIHGGWAASGARCAFGAIRSHPSGLKFLARGTPSW